ncbi:DNA ligase [Perkinsela sp. CCAP 1560/4]|nr:DNA ligase [Perkinsela sp. CCAP 1560/4]|eukprot:KNH09271.1 DNA ligase [Perkinsela sp. CCAP 1560/4]
MFRVCQAHFVKDGLAAMLCSKWTASKHDLLSQVREGKVSKLYCSPKFDGIRCVATLKGLYSRNRLKFDSCTHVHDDVCKLLKTPYLGFDPAKIMLDGELFFMGKDLPFEKIVSAVKKTSKHITPQDVKLQNKIKYHIFDMNLTADHFRKMPYIERMYHIQQMLKNAEKKGSLKNHCLLSVPIRSFRTQDELDNQLEGYLDRGMEGIVVRTPGGLYEPGKRSKGLMKYVPMMEEEFDIYDVKPGAGKFKGSLGSLCCVTSTGKKFFANPAVDEDMRKEWWKKRKNLIGKKATVKFTRYTVHGVPRFPSAKSIRNAGNKRV